MSQETPLVYNQADLSVDELIADLRLLCGLPSSTGNLGELKAAARQIAELVRQAGLHVKLINTPGTPIILGWREGRTGQRILLYHHYDVNPTGPWRAWAHEPYTLAERDQAVYARGVAHGKGALAAHLQAIRSLLRSEHELPTGVVLLIEGAALRGNPHLDGMLRRYQSYLQADICVASAGERNNEGLPFCYAGSKGLLQVRLSVQGAAHPLEPGLAASIANPAWRLLWALNHIKGEDEDIRITGFYDSIAGPRREERDLLRHATLDEAARLAAWQVPEFLFNMSDTALVRSQVTLPTCNISSFVVEPAIEGACIPISASALIDFQLVPDQTPTEVLRLLQKHLVEKGFGDIKVEAQPGHYRPIRSDIQHPAFQRLCASGERVYGTPLSALPIGIFAQPLYLFHHTCQMPVAAVALARPDSAILGSNEHLPINDLVNHSRHLAEYLVASGNLHPGQPDLPAV